MQLKLIIFGLKVKSEEPSALSTGNQGNLPQPP